jgi:hypothetical protein
MAHHRAALVDEGDKMSDQRFDVVVTKKTKDGSKTWDVRIGRYVPNIDGTPGGNLYLDALPVNGYCAIKLNKWSAEHKQAPKQSHPDDDINF